MSDGYTVQMNDAQHADFMAQQREHNARMEDHAKAHADGVRQLLPALMEMVGKPEQHRMEDKRDYFAGQALAGMCANCDESGNNGWSHITDVAASKAYQFADAMIAAREVQS